MQVVQIISQLSCFYFPAILAVRAIAAVGVGYHANGKDASGVVSGAIVLITGVVGLTAYAIAAVFGDDTGEDADGSGADHESIGRLECPDCGRENMAGSKFCAGCTSDLDRSGGLGRLFSRSGSS